MTCRLVAACGKFQPFHNEHLEYVLAAFSRGDHVVVGITNPDPSYVRPEAADPRRGTPEANPATYYERYLMVKGALLDAGIPGRRIDVVPFPLNVPDSWFYYIPREAVFLLTMYADDPWLVQRKQKLEANGVRTHVLWSKDRKGVTGAEIRRRIIAHEDWKELVPQATVEVIFENGIDRRIREMALDSTDGFYRP